MKPELKTTDIQALIQKNNSAYFNEIINVVNDHVVRISIMTAPYSWHMHPNSDETFIGMEGVLLIETPDADYELQPGHVVTISKEIIHRTRPLGKQSVNLTVEKGDLQTIFTGDQ
jgi:mannose-6-phosphate isomerase-like protein (cupin superfamily)